MTDTPEPSGDSPERPPGSGSSWAPPSWQAGAPQPPASEPARRVPDPSQAATAGIASSAPSAGSSWASSAPAGPAGPPAPAQASAPKPGWKAAGLAVAVAASGLIGGAVGHGLDNGRAPTGALAPVPASGGSAVALPVDGFADLYRRVLPAVVEIEAVSTASDSTGSGVIVDTAGSIVTAAHVVGDRSTVTVTLSDGRQLDARVLGRDTQGDLAVLRLDNPPNDLTAVPLGNSDQLAVGQTTAAVGAPFGLRNTLTVGVISGLNRTFSPNPSGLPLRGLIQTDAAINPGSSGGPLFDAAGQVIGINTAIKSPVGGSVGVGFAVPVNQVRESLPLLSEGKTLARPFLGIEGKAGGQGVEVATVTDGSSAAAAGIARGDVITNVDGHRVFTVDDIAAQLTHRKVGDKIDVTVRRDGSDKTFSVELKSLPSAAS